MNWVCPFCQHAQTVVDSRMHVLDAQLFVGTNKFGRFGSRTHVIGCANAQCGEVQVVVYLGTSDRTQWTLTKTLEKHVLRPLGQSKPQPEYIPLALRNDYFEACLIRDLSPKASATLARRCLQGMIRDFCGVKKNRLIDEIFELREQLKNSTAARGVTAESIDAIDAVRQVGNIGAHMEKDVSLIVDIEPAEAQLLIELIEMLFNEWYIERQKRAERLAAISKLSDAKKAAIKSAAGTALPASPIEMK